MKNPFGGSSFINEDGVVVIRSLDETIDAVMEVVAMADYMKNCYFWTPPYTAAGRRHYERNHSTSVVKWEEHGHEYSAAFYTQCTCRYIEGHGDYYKDGKQTNLKAIKNSLRRLLTIRESEENEEEL